MNKVTTDRIPFNVTSIVLQLVCWSVFFALIIAAYATSLRHSDPPTTQQLINQLGSHQ